MFIEGELPPMLAIGSEQPSDESPWWLFRQLSLKSRSDTIGAISTVQERWKKFQKCLFESAYKMAKAGKELIDDQCQAEAKQLLTEYMAVNVEVMLKTVREMLAGTSASNARR
jgi:dipeptidase